MAHSITSLIRIIYASRYASLGLKIWFFCRTDSTKLILQNDVFETKLSFQLIEQSNSVTVLVNNLRHTWVYLIVWWPRTLWCTRRRLYSIIYTVYNLYGCLVILRDEFSWQHWDSLIYTGQTEKKQLVFGVSLRRSQSGILPRWLLAENFWVR